MVQGAFGVIWAAGCASISFDRNTILVPELSVELSVIDHNAQVGPDRIAGTGDEQAVDNAFGFGQLTVPVNSDSDITGEVFTLTQVQLASPVYKGLVKLSSTKGLTSATDGVIFIQENGDGTNPTSVNAQYVDEDINVAGAGLPVPCPDNPLIDSMLTQFVGSDVLFVTAKVTDEGPNAEPDNIADPSETIKLDISVVNSVLDAQREKPDLEDVSITLVTAVASVGPDKPVACILDGSSFYGTLTSGIARFNDPADPFRSMARAYCRLFICRSEDRKEKYLEEMVAKFKVDGILYHDAKTCPNNSNNRSGGRPMRGRLF